MAHPHVASAVLMVRPAAFGFDPATAATNAFQVPPALSAAAIQAKALAEFDACAEQLRAHNIDVLIIQDTPQPPKPDALFPNNWLTTWPDGRIFLYPMHAPARRLERRPDIIQALEQLYQVRDVIDLSNAELHQSYLESTGAIVFDHTARTAYACLSPRCDERLLRQHAAQIGYTVMAFTATDEQGTAIYHTNVMMAIHSKTAIVCLQAIANPQQRHIIHASLQATGHTVIPITLDQMRHFAGNTLELQNRAGERFVAMSQSAFDSLHPDERALVARDKTPIICSVPTIEHIGGGSIRCMIAELFLDKKVK